MEKQRNQGESNERMSNNKTVKKGSVKESKRVYEDEMREQVRWRN